LRKVVHAGEAVGLVLGQGAQKHSLDLRGQARHLSGQCCRRLVDDLKWTI
jgi:hypothetical protein